MNSIIIPHRDRHWNLGACLRWIRKSAEYCGREDYEVIVVDAGSEYLPVIEGKARIVFHPLGMVFNKPKLLNVGINAAVGDVLTFLDADAIVGRRFMAAVDKLADETLTKLCYRVRILPLALTRVADSEWAFDAAMEYHWVRYQLQPLAFEARGDASWDLPVGQVSTDAPLFGNSQFSITREKLGDVRPDERYEGAGFEDIAFNRDIYRAHKEAYRAVLAEEPHECMFHLGHQKTNIPGWRDKAYADRNWERYTQEG